MSQPSAEVDQLAINTIRFLAIDMVERAQSGHPGAPMGQAAMAYWLWTRHLRHDPTDPGWPDRDRFVLSCGHASALLYSLLHLAGYDLPMDELRNFRQLDSKTPGHPELGLTEGVETTTGPLGQGISTAVGMAIGRKTLAAQYGRDDHQPIQHDIWVLASDGDLMEGVASEASSLAGHLRLGSLNVLYDDNKISIDGPTSLSFTEDVAARYRAYGWNVLGVDDGNDLAALDAAMTACREETERPTLVVVRTHIGFGSPNKQDSSSAHGSPLGPDETALTRQALDWPEAKFLVPDEALAPFAAAAERGASLRVDWQQRMDAFRAEHRELAAELDRRLAGKLVDGWREALPRFTPGDGPMATRSASGKVLNALAGLLPEMTGGSADLTPSNNTYLADKGDFSDHQPASPNIRFGVREHAMGAILNGLAQMHAFVPYGGTFLVFSDYMRPAIRLAALMELRVVFVFTHDSIFLGEDGPTHQPVSHLPSLRAIPHLDVVRPADANETAGAWKVALERTDGPTALVLTRQKLPVMSLSADAARHGVERGAYVVADAEDADLILIATGSEVALALDSAAALAASGHGVRVVSMPSWERFERQDDDYRESVLPRSITKRLALEAGSPLGWERYVGLDGEVLAVRGFGASAPIAQLEERYGFNVDEVVRRAQRLLG